MSEYITVREFARRVCLSEKTIYRRLYDGDLPGSQPGGTGTGWRIDWTAFRSMDNMDKAPARGNPSVPTANSLRSSASGPRPKWRRKLEELILTSGKTESGEN